MVWVVFCFKDQRANTNLGCFYNCHYLTFCFLILTLQLEAKELSFISAKGLICCIKTVPNCNIVEPVSLSDRTPMIWILDIF